MSDNCPNHHKTELNESPRASLEGGEQFCAGVSKIRVIKL